MSFQKPLQGILFSYFVSNDVAVGDVYTTSTWGFCCVYYLQIVSQLWTMISNTWHFFNVLISDFYIWASL